MAVAPQEVLGRLRDNLTQLSNGQKVTIIIGLAAAIAVVVGLWLWASTPDYRVLYSNLAEKDGGEIVASLQQMNVPYRIEGNGATILVPSSQVYDLRFKMASQGLPKGGNVGFESLQNQKLGVSQFLEQVNYQRALEGELARTIEAISSVQSARVHLAVPRPSVFVRDQEKPSASIVLALRSGRVLDPGQVSGIVHLVAAAVPEMPISNVTVLDQTGAMLNRNTDNFTQQGLNPSQLEYVHAVEQSYVKRIESILEPIVGAGNLRAQVAADLDFAQSEQTSEVFKPNPTPADSSVRSQQTVETINGAATNAAGVPGALSNQPPGPATAPITAPPGANPLGGAAPAAAGATPSNTHKETTINYEVDKTIRHTKLPVGAVKRLSVAVVVNFRKQVDKDDKASFKPMTPAELEEISNLVREAMGFSAVRGDTVKVVNASFAPPEAPPDIPLWKDPDSVSFAKDMLKNLLIAGVILYIVLGVLRPLFRTLMQARPAPPAELGEHTSDVVHLGAAGSGAAASHGIPRANTYEDNLRIAKEMAKEDPVIVANVVKEWVGQE